MSVLKITCERFAIPAAVRHGCSVIHALSLPLNGGRQ